MVRKRKLVWAFALVLCSCAHREMVQKECPQIPVGKSGLSAEKNGKQQQLSPSVEVEKTAVESKVTSSDLESFPDFNPSENQVCTSAASSFDNHRGFKECLNSLDVEVATEWLLSLKGESLVWRRGLENRMYAYLYLKKNAKLDAAAMVLNDILKQFDQLEPLRVEALEWLAGAAEARADQEKHWDTKLKEIENAIRIGNVYPEILGRLDGWNKEVLSVEKLNFLDSLLAKSQKLDSLRVGKYWQQSQDQNILPPERQKAKNRLLTQYSYLLSKAQKAVLDGEVGDQKEAENYCQGKRKEASEWVIRSRKKQSNVLLEKAVAALNECLDKYPQYHGREKIEGEKARLEAAQ